MKDPNILEYESRHPSKKEAEEFVKNLQALNLIEFNLNDLDEMIDEIFHYIPFHKGVILAGTSL